MARLANLSIIGDDQEDSFATQDSALQRGRSDNAASPSPSPSLSFSSDKENRSAKMPSRTSKNKRASMAPPTLPTPRSSDADSEPSSKRRRLADRDARAATPSQATHRAAPAATPSQAAHLDAPAATRSQTAHDRVLDSLGHKDVYDPDQSIHVRREIRKDYRDLSKDLTDSKGEYLASDSHGLKHTVEKANDLWTKVRQTSDATLDSRLLVSAADLSAKRTEQLQLGDATQGIDVDHFIGRCITFMRRGDAANGTQRRQRRREDDDEDAEENEPFNWPHLGSAVCIPHNLRPPTPGFLLGPLSVQRRIRKQAQRTQRLQKRDPNDAVRPEELKVKDIEKNESNSLTVICTQIRNLLLKIQAEGSQKVDAETTDEMGEEEIAALFEKCNVCVDGGVPLFKFVVNPHSFGQTVENLFYISFLIRDGTCGIGSMDGLPTLRKSTCSISCHP